MVSAKSKAFASALDYLFQSAYLLNESSGFNSKKVVEGNPSACQGHRRWSAEAVKYDQAETLLILWVRNYKGEARQVHAHVFVYAWVWLCVCMWGVNRIQQNHISFF